MAKATAKFVFSTLSTSVAFATYAKGGGDLPIQTGSVVIRGGANVPDKHLITPVGVRTEITAEEYEAIQSNEQFKAFVKNGFLKVTDKPEVVEKVAADMETREPSAPIVPEDYTEEKAPKTSSRKA